MLRIGSVKLENNLLLAPIAGYCDLPFRLIVRSIVGPSGGVGLACTDLLCPEAILRQTETTRWLADTCEQDRPLCMQLYGRHAPVMAQAAQWAESQGAAIIDINMGCPVDKVTKKNGGSKLLTEPCIAVDIVRAVVGAVRVPVTAKIRLGWDDDQLIVDTLPTALADAGAAAITVHGRTTQQKFRGQVCLDGIARVVETVKRRHPNIAVIGNGDVKTPHDAKRMIDATGCDGVMIGRGALGQPWLFRDTAHYLKTGLMLDPLSRAERAHIVLRHFEAMLNWRGEAHRAVNMIRTRISWYSPYLQPWPGLRRDMHAMKSADQVRDYLLAGVARIEQQQDQPIDTAA